MHSQLSQEDCVLSAGVSLLVVGGANSGKTARALVHADGYENRLYVATAEIRDEEMACRVRRHRTQRGEDWTTVESSLDLFDVMDNLSRLPESRLSRTVAIVDCLTMWLANLISHGRDVHTAVSDLFDAIDKISCPIVLVTNEVGQGIVPDSVLGRQFREEQGKANQIAAQRCDFVEWVVCGLPILLKSGGNR